MSEKLQGETIKQYKLYEIVPSKFARSSYYVISGAIGMTFEEMAKRAGHNSFDIAMTHYYNVGKHYTQDDVINSLNILSRRTTEPNNNGNYIV